MINALCIVGDACGEMFVVGATNQYQFCLHIYFLSACKDNKKSKGKKVKGEKSKKTRYIKSESDGLHSQSPYLQ
jgi:hypothetical protein